MEDELKALSQGNVLIFQQDSVPLFQNKVYDTIGDAASAPVGNVYLARSPKTGFIFNKAFDNSIMNYDSHYHNEQSNSGVFKDHLHRVFHLLEKFNVRDKNVVEIGCGKAYFFNILKENQIRCTGFDPAYEGEDPAIIKDYFSDKYNISGDLIVLRHTLEHIEDPHLFLLHIARANNFRGHIFIEVPTFEWIYRKQAFWDIFYEHCNYFTEASLGCMFNKAETGSLFNGQYIYCYAALSDLKEKIEQQPVEALESFSFASSISKWSKFVEEKEQLAIWGAGAKGSTFLNLLDKQRDKIKYVIDINPEKQNRYIAHTGHAIVSPAILEKDAPKNILVMNENYLEEIKELIHTPDINLYTL